MSLADQQWYPTSVKVTVFQAKNLKIKGKHGTNDAYAVMQVAKEKFSTAVAEKTVTPVWKEEASFDLPLFHHGNEERCTLHVMVMHRTLMGIDKQLGQAVINLLELNENKNRNKTEWFKLLNKHGKEDKERGQVLLDIQFMRNNMTASMFDLSGQGKSRSRMGKLKDKLRGKKSGHSDSASAIVPSSSYTMGSSVQVMTDSEEDGEDDAGDADAKKKKKKSKIKALFGSKGSLQRNISQSMVTLGSLPEKNSTLSGSRSSGLSVDSNEGKKKFKFLTHKRTDSSDSRGSLGTPFSKQGVAEPSGVCINGSHVYVDSPVGGSTLSLNSSDLGSVEDLRIRLERSSLPGQEGEDEETTQKQEMRRLEEEREKKQLEEEDERKREEEEEMRRREEEVRRRVEEEEMRRREEEMEIRRREEEKLRRREEEEMRRRAEEEMRKMKEEEEERRREEEEMRRRQEEEMRVRAEEEEMRRREEEEIMRRKELEEERRREEEMRRKKAEELRLREEEEEMRKREEEEIRLLKEQEQERREEEMRRKAEEEMKIKEEEEERRREEEEMRRRQDEEMRVRAEEEEMRRRREEEEMRLREEEEMRRRQEEEMRLREEEEMRRRQEEEMRLREEEMRREEERKREEEEMKMKEEEEERRKEEEEMRRREEEEMKLREEEEMRVREEEMRREEEKKREEEEMRMMKEEEEERRREEEETRRMKEEEKRKKEEEIRRREEEEETRRQKEGEEMRKREEEEEMRRIREVEQRREEEEMRRWQEEQELKEREEIRRREEEEEMRRKEQEEMRKRKEKQEEEERRRKEEEEEMRREEELITKKREEEAEMMRKQEEEERRRREEEEEMRIKQEEEEEMRREEEMIKREREAEVLRKQEEEERRRREEVEEMKRKQEEEEEMRREEEEMMRKREEENVKRREREEEEEMRRREEEMRREEQELERSRLEKARKEEQEGSIAKYKADVALFSDPFAEFSPSNPLEENAQDATASHGIRSARVKPSSQTTSPGGAESPVVTDAPDTKAEKKRRAPVPPPMPRALPVPSTQTQPCPSSDLMAHPQDIPVASARVRKGAAPPRPQATVPTFDSSSGERPESPTVSNLTRDEQQQLHDRTGDALLANHALGGMDGQLRSLSVPEGSATEVRVTSGTDSCLLAPKTPFDDDVDDDDEEDEALNRAAVMVTHTALLAYSDSLSPSAAHAGDNGASSLGHQEGGAGQGLPAGEKQAEPIIGAVPSAGLPPALNPGRQGYSTEVELKREHSVLKQDMTTECQNMLAGSTVSVEDGPGPGFGWQGMLKRKNRAPLPPRAPEQDCVSHDGDSLVTPPPKPCAKPQSEDQKAKPVGKRRAPQPGGEAVSGGPTLPQARVSPSEPQPTTMQSCTKGGGVAGKVGGLISALRRTHPVKPLGSLESHQLMSNPGGDLGGTETTTKVTDPMWGGGGPYSQLTHPELTSLVMKQQGELYEKDLKIKELEDYIDNLLVRVIEEKPSILMSLNAAKKAV